MQNHPYSTWPRSSVVPQPIYSIHTWFYQSPVLQNKWSITQGVMWEAVTRGAWWPTGDYSGKEAEHTVWPSRNESSRPLISAPLPMRANSSQLLPSRPLLQIDSGPQVLLTASLSLSPSTLNPIRFPYRWRPHTFTQRQWTSSCSHNIFYANHLLFTLSINAIFIGQSASTRCLVLLYWMRNSHVSREYIRSSMKARTNSIFFPHYCMAALKAVVGAIRNEKPSFSDNLFWLLAVC